MSIIITGITIYVKIKNVAKRRKQLKRIWWKPSEKRVLKIWKKMLTRFKSSDTLSKSLGCDNKKQIATAKVVRKKMVFENWTEYI